MNRECLTIIGTAHVSEKSVEEVKDAIYEKQPDVVAIELDRGRYTRLRKEMAGIEEDDTIPITQIIKENKIGVFLVSTILGHFQSKIGAELDVKPGSEMIGAIEAAEDLKIPIALIDRDEFQRFLYGVWTKEPEAMTTKEIHVLTGYSLGTVGQWICHEKLKSTKLPTVRVVAKEWLVEYICEYTISNPSRLSHINLQLVTEYMKTM